jgi:hypothetical protein
MSESGSPEREVPEFGLVADEDLPEDLQPAENPLARDPDDQPAGEEESGGTSRVEGVPDLGEPGPAG